MTWVNETGLDWRALFRAHVTTLDSRESYTVYQRLTSTVEAETATLEATANCSRVQQRVRMQWEVTNRTLVGLAPGTYTTYVTGDTGYVRKNLPDSQPTYVRQSVTFDRRYQQSIVPISDFWTRAVVRFEYEFTGTVTREGESLYRFEADSIRPDVEESGWTDTESPSATLLVSRNGRIVHSSLSFTGTRGGQREAVSATYTTEKVGTTTVRRPTWLDEARDNT